MNSLSIKCLCVILVSICLGSLFSSAVAWSFVDDIGPKLSAHVQRYDLSAQNFVDALAIASAHFQLPMGIEWVDTPSAKAALTMHWNEATVENVIRDIVKAQPEYGMKIANGVVHVYLLDEVPAKENFLRVKLPRFEIADQSIDNAQRQLRRLVRLTVSPPPKVLPGRRGGVVGSGLSTIEQPLVTLDLSDVDVEDILDRFALSSPRPIWIVTFSADRTPTPVGLRRTLSLWNPSQVPDGEQPIWDMFHWGDNIPNALLGRK